MSARVSAAFCLISLVVLPVPGHSNELPSNELLVYLSVGSSGQSTQSQRPLDYMKLELGRLMTTAGYRVEWRDARSPHRETVSGDVAFVELRGVCGFTPGERIPEAVAKVESFATTAVSEGRVLPFSSIRCDTLTTALAAGLASEPAARRDYLYGRAIARVLAHELYHVLLRTADHARGGVARASFRASDLLAERFDFEQTTLARLQRQPAAESHVAAEAVGR